MGREGHWECRVYAKLRVGVWGGGLKDRGIGRSGYWGGGMLDCVFHQMLGK